MNKFIKKFNEINLACVGEVGFKSAYVSELHAYNYKGILLADGFAITNAAYKHFVNYNDLENILIVALNDLRTNRDVNFDIISTKAKSLIMRAKMPADLGMAIIDAYDYLFDTTDTAVSVSTSFTFTMPFDNPDKTLDTDLNVQGHNALLYAVRKCFANLFSVSALKNIAILNKSIWELDVSVCVQQLIRADKACSGNGVTTDPEFSGENVTHITASWGLGRKHVAQDDHDDYWIYKPSLNLATPLLEAKLGNKKTRLINADDYNYGLQTVLENTPITLQTSFVLNFKEMIQLAKYSVLIEKHFGVPMLFSWAKDGINHQIFILAVTPADAGKPKLLKKPLKLFKPLTSLN